MPFATGKHRTVMLVTSISSLLLLCWLDYATGYEFGFFIFYFIPVSVAAWYLGRMPGLAMACASALCWFLADRMTKHPYSRAYFIYWETFMRLASFVTTAVTLAKIREVVDERRQLQEALRRSREENAEMKRRLAGGGTGEPAHDGR
jgi:K+-sensing histidine kinase KdpD